MTVCVGAGMSSYVRHLYVWLKAGRSVLLQGGILQRGVPLQTKFPSEGSTAPLGG
jgi:hypothetical protein